MIQQRSITGLIFWLSLSLLVTTHAVGQQPQLETLSDKPLAPELRLPNRQGQWQSLSDWRGHVVVVNFWATWCRPCREEMPAMQRAWEQLQDQGVIFLGINWGDHEDSMRRFFEHITVDFPILVDEDRTATAEWGIVGLPTTYVIDPQGRQVYRVIGERDWDEPELMQKVLDLR
jgi:peroxiredoxin